MFTFWSFRNGADCMVHLFDSTARISRLFGMMYSSLWHANFLVASSGGIYLNRAELSLICSLFTVFHSKNRMGFLNLRLRICFLLLFSVLLCGRLNPLRVNI